MSDRCFGWRMLLTRHSDGDLSRYEWEALDDHLAGCRECRTAAQSDRTLHLALSKADFHIDGDAGRRIDDCILRELGIPERLSVAQRGIRALKEFWAGWEAIPNLTLMQAGTGTLVAASLTALFLLTALHPLDLAPRSGSARFVVMPQRNEPPVPLESLLDHPVPRAALLWTVPERPRRQEREKASPMSPARGVLSPSAPSLPDRHSPLPEGSIRG